jgi:hypothetical protein
VPLPVSVDTVTVTGQYTHPDGTGMRGAVTLIPRPTTVVDADTGLAVQGPAREPFDDDGNFTLTVVATDSTGINPTDFTYEVRLSFYDAVVGDAFDIALPKAAPEVSLPAITPVTPADGDYIVITGPAGPAGPQGPAGPPGAAGGTYLHTQTTPAATWQITHALGRTPNLSLIDTGGRVVYADIVHNSALLAVVSFPSPVAGTAMCS